MTCFLGIDSSTTATKALLMGADAEVLGVGTVEPGIVALTLGTSGVVFASTVVLILAQNRRIARSTSPDRDNGD